MDDEELLQVLRKMEGKKALLITGADPALSAKKRYLVKGVYEASD